MTYIPSKPQRLYCRHCDDTYSLPQGGSIKLYKVASCAHQKPALYLCQIEPSVITLSPSGAEVPA